MAGGGRRAARRAGLAGLVGLAGVLAGAVGAPVGGAGLPGAWGGSWGAPQWPAGPEPYRPDPAGLAAWLEDEGAAGGGGLDGAEFPGAALGLAGRALLRARGALESWLGPQDLRQTEGREEKEEGGHHHLTFGPPTFGKYFGFLPTFEGNLVPGGDWISWDGGCFKNTRARMVLDEDGRGWTIEMKASRYPRLCTESYVLATPSGLKAVEIFAPFWSNTISWRKSSDEHVLSLEEWYVSTQGIKIFRLPKGFLSFGQDLLKTLYLFEPMFQKKIMRGEIKDNYAFVNEYAGLKPQKLPRTAGFVEIPEEAVGSGDFFGIFRADGVDPMLAWGMGSSTGHTTVALRDPEGLMHVCESQDKSAYWSVNGVQCTPLRVWLQRANAAGYDVVHAPLSPEYRAKFDEAKAWEWFKTVEGLNYGFHNMLWGWLDTVKSNYPCTPPDYQSTCLTWPFIEVGFGLIDSIMPSLADLMWRQAWMLRLGKGGERLSTMEIYRLAAEQGMALESLPTIVEQDTWIYDTTRYGEPAKGRSMVCCVFVCAVWKEAGIFEEIGNDVNCGEFVNEDVYMLNVFEDPEKRPEACKKADPDNPVCQLMGSHTLYLNSYNTRPMTAHMAENCPSLAPDYVRPAGC